MSHPRTIRFDGWELRMDSGELAKDGRKTRLQDQPLQILEELLSHPGELVTREQLIARLWPKGVVDFDTGLNSAVRKLRIALHDEVGTPRYIETVPRKGYRFIAAVDPQPATPASPAAPVTRSRRTYLYAGGAIALLLVAANRRPRASRRPPQRRPCHSTVERLPCCLSMPPHRAKRMRSSRWSSLTYCATGSRPSTVSLRSRRVRWHVWPTRI
jgi:DNA-binding winged helix-turn-helix (wHTH) protein